MGTIGGAEAGERPDVRTLLRDAERAGGIAPAALFGVLYRELHRLAERQLRGGALDVSATTLLHEAYLELAGGDASFAERRRFFAYAARAMRSLVVDHARASRALKRGGAFHLTRLDTASAERPAAEDLSRLGDALDALAACERGLAELVDLKFFCGLSLREIAALRGVSERTAQRDWSKARLWLHRWLAP